MTIDGYITMSEAAERLACSTRTIVRHIQAGDLRGVKLHNRWYIEEESIKEYLSEFTPAQLAILDAKRKSTE